MTWDYELQTDARTRDYVVSAEEFEKVCKYTMEEASREDEITFRIGGVVVHVNTIGEYVYMLVDSEEGYVFAITFTTAECGGKKVPVTIFDDGLGKAFVALLGRKVEEVLSK
jgi:hypothetical protein